MRIFEDDAYLSIDLQQKIMTLIREARAPAIRPRLLPVTHRRAGPGGRRRPQGRDRFLPRLHPPGPLARGLRRGGAHGARNRHPHHRAGRDRARRAPHALAGRRATGPLPPSQRCACASSPASSRAGGGLRRLGLRLAVSYNRTIAARRRDRRRRGSSWAERAAFLYGVLVVLPDIPGHLPLRDRIRRQPGGPEVDRLRRRETLSLERARHRCAAARSVRHPAQRHGAAVLQARLDAGHPRADRAQHLRAAREPVPDPALLAMAADDRGHLARAKRHRTYAGPAHSFGLGWLTVLASTFLVEPLRSVRSAPGHALPARYALRAGRLRPPLLYRVVRHPIYLGFLFAFWATHRR